MQVKIPTSYATDSTHIPEAVTKVAMATLVGGL